MISEQEELAGYAVIENPKEGFTVKLKPSASIKGRLVDVNGDAIENARIESETSSVPASAIALPLPPLKEENLVRHEYSTDEDGAFTLHSLVSNVGYTLQGSHHRGDFDYVSNNFATDVILKPGETKDLGDVVLKKMTPEELKKQAKVLPRPIAIPITE